MPSTHHIQRQRFRIKVNSQEDADFIHNTVGGTVRDQLVPRLEQLLDGFVGPDETIRIDRLHLDVGELSREGFAEQLVDAVIEAMDQKLRRLPPAATNSLPAETTTKPFPKNHFTMEDGLFVHNAGLVILAPFLPRYFKMLDMLEDGAFPDEETATRAALLLQYLASGQTETPEHLLVFNKVICGLDVATPVPESIEISDQEEEVSRQMLNAVLQNWDKMSNSTVDNLRASFLLREGLLREHDDHFALIVEQKGFDILLSFLPWTISLVSLTWMGKRVETEWKTSMG